MHGDWRDECTRRELSPCAYEGKHLKDMQDLVDMKASLCYRNDCTRCICSQYVSRDRSYVCNMDWEEKYSMVQDVLDEVHDPDYAIYLELNY